MSKENSRSLDLEGEFEPSESEDEYSEEEKRLLSKVRKGYNEDSDSEEEVYGFSASESEKDDIANSDIEGQEDSVNDIPDSRAWGQKKRAFYSTDYVDEDYGGFGKDEEAATLEEKEARILQNKLAENLEDDDFALEFYTSKKSDDKDNDKQIIIKSDLSQMSKREKLQLLEKESPEFSGLVEDFKAKISLTNSTLYPVMKLFREGVLPKCPAMQFVRTQYDLILNYCTNLSFYILLKTKRINIQNHPVIKRLFQYRQMLKQLEPIFEKDIKPQLEEILKAVENNDTIRLITDNDKENKKRKITEKQRPSKKLKLISKMNTNSEGMQNNDDFEDSGSSGVSDEEENDMANDLEASPVKEIAENEIIDGDGTEKRAITYQMAKNKGLTPHRKKEQRNPRVKHRNKFRKAQIRRKGAVRTVRHEMSRYAGELTGIKANVKKSIKIR